MDVHFQVRGYNARLVQARESAGHTTKASFADSIGMARAYFGGIEGMKIYPGKRACLKIIQGLARDGVRSDPEYLFPPGLKAVAKSGGIRADRAVDVPEHVLLEAAGAQALLVSGVDVEVLVNEKEALVTEAMEALDSRSRRVVQQHLEGVSFTDIGKELCRTPERVRQLHMRAVKSMRSFCEQRGYPGEKPRQQVHPDTLVMTDHKFFPSWGEDTGGDTLSFKAEVQTAGNGDKWDTNAIRFETEEEADNYSRDLEARWMAVTARRTAPSDDPVNYRWTGKLEAV